MEENEVISALAALAHSQRLRVYRALVVAGPAGLTPGVMAEGLNVARSALSFHLKELTHSGLVTQERSGKHLIYRAIYSQMNDLLEYLTSNCCEGAGCLPSTSTVCAC